MDCSGDTDHGHIELEEVQVYEREGLVKEILLGFGLKLGGKDEEQCTSTTEAAPSRPSWFLPVTQVSFRAPL